MGNQFTSQELVALNALVETGERVDGFELVESKLAAYIDAACGMRADESSRFERDSEHVLSLLATVTHYAARLEQYAPERAESLMAATQAAKREYDSLRNEIAYLRAMARAYQESESALRDRLQSVTGARY